MKYHGFIFLDLLVALLLSGIFVPIIISSSLNLIQIHEMVLNESKQLSHIQNKINSSELSFKQKNNQINFAPFTIFEDTVKFTPIHWLHRYE